jgi:NADH:ubiquinone oxidoreductase subunit 2 (subunit N)
LNLALIAPEISLLATAIVVILLDLFVQRKNILAVVGLAGLAVAFGFTTFICGAVIHRQFLITCWW